MEKSNDKFKRRKRNKIKLSGVSIQIIIISLISGIFNGLIGAGVYASHGYERSHKDGVENTLLVLKGYLGV